ncbi:MAG TPA: Gfo/Idh/MocA family oxidoreductase [Chloroflexota bacterium]|nr:Gfo/Idh/MocA family oxidoreductase [Chloroflexota bacterium]
MAETLRLGIVGLGMGAGRVIPEIAKLPFITIAAGADVRKHALDQFQEEFGAAAFTSVEEMCQSRDIDAVYVATPHEYHAQHSIVALKHKKHVIVEKPMALSIDECEAMNRAADENGVWLLCGHTHSFDPPVRKMREVVRSGDLGRPLMINASYYKNFIYRPFSDHDEAMSRGIVLNQGPHQVDIVRLLGGGLVRSVRAVAGAGDPTRGEPPARPAEGHYVCFLEFENGVPASLVFSGYAYLDTAELVWGIGEGGNIVNPDDFVQAHRFFAELGAGPERAKKMESLLESWRYGGQAVGEWFTMGRSGSGASTERHQPFFGLNIVTCERGDVRQSPDGVYVYTAEGRRELPIEKGAHGREAEMRELYDAVVENRRPFHDGRWGEATLEVCLAILESTATHREITMTHQVPAE